METSIKVTSGVRRLAVASVVVSVLIPVLAAAVLPPAAVGFLPVLALLLPFIAAGVVDGRFELAASAAHA
ncbi:MAG TPA: hypothetical protein VF331_05005 [Polyangiales bacterium]